MVSVAEHMNQDRSQYLISLAGERAALTIDPLPSCSRACLCEDKVVGHKVKDGRGSGLTWCLYQL